MVVSTTVKHVLETLGAGGTDTRQFVSFVAVSYCTEHTWMDVGHCLDQTQGWWLTIESLDGGGGGP